jgi:hypothetical protein
LRATNPALSLGPGIFSEGLYMIGNVMAEVDQRHPGSGRQANPASSPSDHRRLMDAGWSYRMNERGWIIYRAYSTGRWYILQDGLAILDGRSVETRKR